MYSMKKKLAMMLVVSSCILPIGCKGQYDSSNQEIGKIAEEGQASEVLTNPFAEGVRAATEASQLTQTAKTYQEWEKISHLWQQAIDQMQAVSNSDTNYEMAQQKAQEYQTNIAYAQRIIDLQNMHVTMGDAVYNNDIQKIRELLKQGFDPNHQDIDEDTVPGHPSGYVLFTGAFSGRDQSVEELVKAGAKWDYLDQDNTLSLILLSASCNGQPFIVEELIKAGADPNFTSRDENPLILAKSQSCRTTNSQGNNWQPGEANHDQVVQVLLQAGAK